MRSAFKSGYEPTLALGQRYLHDCSISWSLLVLSVVGGVVYAPAELATTIVLWLIQLSVLVLLYNKKSSPYYGREAVA